MLLTAVISVEPAIAKLQSVTPPISAIIRYRVRTWLLNWVVEYEDKIVHLLSMGVSTMAQQPAHLLPGMTTTQALTSEELVSDVLDAYIHAGELTTDLLFCGAHHVLCITYLHIRLVYVN